MTSSIATILKDLIEPLDFVDKIAGLTHTAEVRQQIDENTTQVDRFPISCDVVDTVTCDTASRYKDLVPNDAYKSILYFEDGGTSNVGTRGKDTIYRSRLRLVGWLNGKKLGSTSCSTSGEAIKEILKTLPRNRFNSGDITRLQVRVNTIAPKTKAIFSRYTYNDQAQFLIYPFDYFAIDIDVTFHVNPSCLGSLVVGVEDPCNYL